MVSFLTKAGIFAIFCIYLTACVGSVAITPTGKVEPVAIVTGSEEGITIELPDINQMAREFREFNKAAIPRGPFGLNDTQGRTVPARRVFSADPRKARFLVSAQEIRQLGANGCYVIADRGNRTFPFLRVRSGWGSDAYHFAFPEFNHLLEHEQKLSYARQQLSRIQAEHDKLINHISDAKKILMDGEVFDGKRCRTPAMKPLPPRPQIACASEDEIPIAGATCGNALEKYWPECSAFDEYSHLVGELPDKGLLKKGCQQPGHWEYAANGLLTFANTVIEHQGATQDCKDLMSDSCSLINQLLEKQSHKVALSLLPECVSKIKQRCSDAESQWNTLFNTVKTEPVKRFDACQSAKQLLGDNANISLNKLENQISQIQQEISSLENQNISSFTSRDLSQYSCN